MARPISALTTLIRALPKDLPVADVIAKAKAAGHETSESNVSRVRKMAGSKPASLPRPTAKKAARPSKAASSKPAAGPRKTAAPGTAKSAGVSKSAFIRLHPNLSTADVIAKGKAAGLKFTSSLVYMVRGRAAHGPPSRAASSAPVTHGPSASKPAGTAHGAEGLLKAVAAELGLGHAIDILQEERARVRGVIGR
jgi:hypothetical protein